MALPRISIVTPSFNQVPFLEETMRSVLEQGYANLEYGVIDGGSTDGSVEIIERYRDRLAFAVIEPDRGQSHAINKGLARLSGDIVAWLNSDDTLLPGALARVGRFFAEHPAADWLVGQAMATDESGKVGDIIRPTGDFSLRGALLRRQRFAVPQPATFWRRSLTQGDCLWAESGGMGQSSDPCAASGACTRVRGLTRGTQMQSPRGLTERLGLLDESLHVCMDFELWCRFLAAGHRPALLDEPLATYRFHDASKSRSRQAAFPRALIEIEKRYVGRLPLRQQWSVRRSIGYQTRAVALQGYAGRPWKLVLRRPWWLGSRQVLRALLHGLLQAKEQRTAATTWDGVWRTPDADLAQRRLDHEKRGRRWNDFHQVLREQLGDRPLRCVELGSGEGDFSVLLAQQGHQVTLVDFSEKAIARARQRFAALGLEGRFVVADLFAFAQANAGAFDVSLSLGLAEHFSGGPRREIILAHRNVLRPGGITLISVPHRYCVPYQLRKTYLKLRGWWPYGYTAPFSAGELARVARTTGLVPCRTYHTGFAASVDACLLQLATGKRRGWGDGPAWANRLCGWDVNLLATAA